MEKEKSSMVKKGNTIKAIWVSFIAWVNRLLLTPEFYVYLLAVLVYLPWFLPNLSDISSWDETYYVFSGKQLLEGQIPSLAGSPLTAFFYALCYLPFTQSPYWLVHANSIGRFLLFSSLFFGMWQVGKALNKLFSPLILLGFLFLSPVLTYYFEYPADPLLIFCSSIAFSQAVKFLDKKKIPHLGWASFWLGVGMLARGDALFIILPLGILVVFSGYKYHKWWRLIVVGVLPFLAVVSGFVFFRGVLVRDFSTGMAEYSYTVFEQGQEVDLPAGPQRFANPTESFYVARERFGTPQENNYSIFNAIKTNPQAYLSRVKSVIRWIPGVFLNSFYRRYTPFLTLLVVRGFIELIYRKRIELTLLHLVWFVPFIAVIARTLVRPGYFYMFMFVVFSLAAVGLTALIDNLSKGREGFIWAGVFALLLVFASVKNESGIQFSMILLLGWLVLTYLLAKKSTKLPNWKSMSLLLLLVMGLMMKVDYLLFEPRILGEDVREEASLVLRTVTDPRTKVLTGTPSVVIMADREVANFSAADIPEFESSEDFIRWMSVQNFTAIYLDWEAPRILWDLTLEQVDNNFVNVWSSSSNDAQIFLLNEE